MALKANFSLGLLSVVGVMALSQIIIKMKEVFAMVKFANLFVIGFVLQFGFALSALST